MTDGTSFMKARQVRQIIVDLAVLFAIGLVLAVLAPLGTDYMSLPGRIAYWVLLAVAGYAFYKPIGALVLRLGPALELPKWFLWIAGVLIASIPMAALVWVVNAGGAPVRVPSLDIALTHYFFVCVVGAVVTVTFNLLPATSGTESADDRAAGTASAPAGQKTSEPVQESAPAEPRTAPANAAPFLERLPPELGSEPLALEMEDHYVRAHTALGNDLVLMRMRDAVGELGGIEGAQVHRSWWVARGSVADVKRDGRNIRLVLDNGLEAPVSRANVQPLREAGWF